MRQVAEPEVSIFPPLPDVCDAVRVRLPADAAKLTEERRQGVDLRAIRSQVTEHRGLGWRGACGKRHVSRFHFDDMLSEVAERAPNYQLATIADVGAAVAFLALPIARMINGDTIYIDGRYHVMG